MTSPPPLYGLLLAGGKSTRMGQDKALLAYHQAPQLVHGANLLAVVCQAVFLSRSPGQKTAHQPSPCPIIWDRHLNIGPMGGLLSAMEAHPHVAWLVLACDMPLMNATTLKQLAEARDLTRHATVFYHPHTHRAEPLCALYEPSLHPFLEAQRQQEQYGLQNLLAHIEHRPLYPRDVATLQNCNDREAFRQARAFLNA